MRPHRRRPAGLALGLALALAAASVLPRSPLPVHPVVAAGTCATARSAGALDAEEQAMLSLINSYRARNGIGPLWPSLSLTRSALWKSTDMAANRYFAHDDLIRGWSQRISDCGYGTAMTGENLAEGNADAVNTFEQWRTSPPHNANLLNPAFLAIGIGRAQSPSGDWYWTADFGGTAESASPANTIGAAAPIVSVLTPPPLPSTVTAAGLAIGSAAAVNTPGDCLRARAAPSMRAAVQTCLPDGTPVSIVAGPVTAEGHTWWQALGAGWVAGEYLRPTG